MAQLKNTVVQGSLKVTDTIYSSTGQFQIIKAPTSSGGSTYGPGTNGQVLKSNGSSVYWAADNNNTYYAPTTAGTAGQFLKAVGGTSMPTWNNIYYSDIKPAIKKTYASTSYYATAANDNAKSAFYFMNIRPNDWNKPWTVKFKIHSFCPNYSTYQSTTECTLSGRQQDIIYHNWNEQINTAHVYISMLRLKSAGYNAGLGHAVGINILNGGNYTNSNYYRTFEVEYYECDACEVTLLDAPVLQANWSNYNTTNYNTISNYDAFNRGLRESGDDNDINRSTISYPRITTGSVGIGRYTLFMETADGTYQSITSTFNSTGTSHVKNSALFRPERIFYRNTNSDLGANNSTDGNNSWMDQQTDRINLRYSTNCGTTLTARKPVYLVGTIDANGFLTLDDTWWTQTEPTVENGKVYIYLGMAYPDDTSNTNAQYRIAFELDNPIYWYKNGSFVLYESPYLFSTALANTDLNTLTSDAIYKRRLYSLFGAGGNGCTNLPIGDGEAFGLLSYPTASGYLTQELSSNVTATIGKWLRWYNPNSDTWTAWQKVITNSTGDFTKRVLVAASPGYLRIIDNQYFSDNRVYLDFTIGSTSGKQGILSSGYYTKPDRSAFVENSKWLIYRDVGGDVFLNGSAKYLTNLGRLTSANLDSSSAEYLNKAFVFYASGSMTEGKPEKDSVIFHCSWDNNTWASQLALPINKATDRSVQWRGSDNTAWGDWRTLLDSNNYTDYTVTKTGTGASGTWSITADKATKDANGLNISTGYLKLSGGTMTGELKTSFNGAVAIGSRVSSQTTIDGLCEELRFSSGCMGSVNITTAYTMNGITIPGGGAWYNYIWVPHRSGGNSGAASGDNCNYGTLYLYTMNSTTPHGFILTYAPTGSSGQTAIVKLTATAEFQSAPVNGQVLIGDGVYGTIKASGYTIAKSVPSDAIFTDNKVQQSTSVSANWRKIMLGKREMSSPNTALETITDVIYGAQAIEAQPSTGTLRANIYRVASNVELQWNSTDSSLDFVFI